MLLSTVLKMVSPFKGEVMESRSVVVNLGKPRPFELDSNCRTALESGIKILIPTCALAQAKIITKTEARYSFFINRYRFYESRTKSIFICRGGEISSANLAILFSHTLSYFYRLNTAPLNEKIYMLFLCCADVFFGTCAK